MQQEFDLRVAFPQSWQLSVPREVRHSPSYPGADFFLTSHPSPSLGLCFQSIGAAEKPGRRRLVWAPKRRLDDQLPRCSLQPAGRSQSTNWKMISLQQTQRARHFSVRKRTMSSNRLQASGVPPDLISTPELSQLSASLQGPESKTQLIPCGK